MLVVKLELHDANMGGAVSELGRVVIANTGTGDPVYGDYVVAVGSGGQDPHSILQTPQKRGHVHDHPRLKASAWALVAKALQSVGFARARRSEVP
jgi:hypothetical protein